MASRNFVANVVFAAATITALAGAQSGPPPGYSGGPPPGGEPALNVSPELHGNIARAQELSRQAFDYMTAAQLANEYDMGGHAARAKELLREANQEMKLSALAANRR